MREVVGWHGVGVGGRGGGAGWGGAGWGGLLLWWSVVGCGWHWIQCEDWLSHLSGLGLGRLKVREGFCKKTQDGKGEELSSPSGPLCKAGRFLAKSKAGEMLQGPWGSRASLCVYICASYSHLLGLNESREKTPLQRFPYFETPLQRIRGLIDELVRHSR